MYVCMHVLNTQTSIKKNIFYKPESVLNSSFRGIQEFERDVKNRRHRFLGDRMFEDLWYDRFHKKMEVVQTH